MRSRRSVQGQGEYDCAELQGERQESPAQEYRVMGLEERQVKLAQECRGFLVLEEHPATDRKVCPAKLVLPCRSTSSNRRLHRLSAYSCQD